MSTQAESEPNESGPNESGPGGAGPNESGPNESGPGGAGPGGAGSDGRELVGEDGVEGGHLTGPGPDGTLSSPGVADGLGSTHEIDAALLEQARAERDEYRDALRCERADFENYRKRVAKSHGEQVERAAGDLVSKLLPVLDTVDLAVSHMTDAGDASLEQVRAALTDTLAREGLERIDPAGQPFDPTEHDAVVLDPGEPGDPEAPAAAPEVTAVLRAGYRWKGRVLRPAMVKVRG